jgi:NAD(P)-dependent dehydrogenase (short-subunit alcohol dehydrogenase family)
MIRHLIMPECAPMNPRIQTSPHTRRTALVTGANRGIGEAIAAGLSVRNDIHVIVGSRDLEAGEAAAQRMNHGAVAARLDLTSRETTRRDIEAILAVQGPIDILVNNAGVLHPGPLLSIDDGAFADSLQVNMLAALDLIRAVAPGMAANGYGRIVNISSGWGSFEEGLTGPPAYCVSKAALNALTLSLVRELPRSIKINAACPGWVRTRMGGQAANRSPEEGADTPIWLATLPEDGPTGGFFRDRHLVEW